MHSVGRNDNIGSVTTAMTTFDEYWERVWVPTAHSMLNYAFRDVAEKAWNAGIIARIIAERQHEQLLISANQKQKLEGGE